MLTETPLGLLVKGKKLLLDTVAGTEAYARMKAGILKALSVGFRLPADGFSIKAGVLDGLSREWLLKSESLSLFGKPIPFSPVSTNNHCKSAQS